MRLFLSLALAALLAPVGLQAAEVTDLAPFKAVELLGDGRIEIRRGPAQRVTLAAGDHWADTFQVKPSGSLVIKGCKGCGDRFRVVIVTPDLEGLATVNEGEITVERGFGERPALHLSVTGKGRIDARNLPAQSVNAVVAGDGQVRTSAGARLTASITGGGAIRYSGDPKVVSTVVGDGIVSRATD